MEKKAPVTESTRWIVSKNGGGGGIRTHGPFRVSGFQDRRDRPLCHPSICAGHCLPQGLRMSNPANEFRHQEKSRLCAPVEKNVHLLSDVQGDLRPFEAENHLQHTGIHPFAAFPGQRPFRDNIRFNPHKPQGNTL